MKLFRTLLFLPAFVLALLAQAPSPKLTDGETEELARTAITLQDPAAQKAALAKLDAHRFRTSKIKEREFVLYAQGLLQDRLGDPLKAAATLHKLELTWPQSPYLTEVQTILALQSVERRRFRDAEERLRKALDSDIPVESKRRTQELLLWTLCEQGRPAEGIPIVKTLNPLGAAKPSERGLVAILEVLSLTGEKDQAKGTLKDFQTLYPESKYQSRANLAWAKLLGSAGDTSGAADALQKILTKDKDSPEADEAKLTLATLLADGKLKPKEANAFPTPEKLLAELRKSELKGDMARRTLLVELKLDMNQARWKAALDVASKLMAGKPPAEDQAAVAELRAQALRSLAQQLMDQKALDPLLPYLDAQGINTLSPEQRTTLVRAMAQTGLPEAARAVVEAAPAKERPGLLKVIAEATAAEAQPEEALRLLPAKGETPVQALRRAQALIALHRWPEAKTALLRAAPGPDRISALLACLQRPADKGEGASARLKETEGLLARLPEKEADREPIVILAGDLRAKAQDWKGALALYPAQPQKGNRGWVALMRATCQLKLGQKDAAKATLKAVVDEPDFKMERQTLGKPLGL